MWGTTGLEADLRHILSAGARLEIIVVPLESAHTGPNAVGKLPDKRVVVLNLLVVAHSGHADPVFRARDRLEIIVVPLESAHTGPNAVGKLPDKRVVVLNLLVVAHSGHADPVFRARQFVREALKILIRLQVWIILRQRQQPSQRAIELAVSL